MLPRECLERIRLFKRILYVFVRFSLGWIIIKISLIFPLTEIKDLVRISFELFGLNNLADY